MCASANSSRDSFEPEQSERSDDESFEQLLDRCEAVLQYRFDDRSLLKRALMHASLARTRLESNERLEFFGDAILGMLVCEILYDQFPEDPEGELTRIKSAVVSRNTCAAVSQQLGLDEFLLLGKGLSTHESIPASVVSAVFESLIGAIYLDGGLEAARRFVSRIMLPEIETAAESAHGRNFKSLLQQLAQKNFAETPVYRLLDEKGPDHSKCFKMSAVIGDRVFPAAWGTNKKEAEQRAAHNAVYQLEGKPAPHPAD